jgi:hypothetical protein
MVENDDKINGSERSRKIIITIYLVLLIICGGAEIFLDDLVLGLISHIGWAVPVIVGILYFSRIVESRFGLVFATITITVLAILGYFGYLGFMGSGCGWGPWPCD